MKFEQMPTALGFKFYPNFLQVQSFQINKK